MKTTMTKQEFTVINSLLSERGFDFDFYNLDRFEVLKDILLRLNSIEEKLNN